jgi:hypothetical protein
VLKYAFSYVGTDILNELLVLIRIIAMSLCFTVSLVDRTVIYVLKDHVCLFVVNKDVTYGGIGSFTSDHAVRHIEFYKAHFSH